MFMLNKPRLEEIKMNKVCHRKLIFTVDSIISMRVPANASAECNKPPRVSISEELGI